MKNAMRVRNQTRVGGVLLIDSRCAELGALVRQMLGKSTMMRKEKPR